jgi:predicted nucleic acid-binding protein
LVEPIILKAIENRKAHKTKLPDAIIAATALVNELIIITRNTKDFDKIKGLEVLNPYDI